MLVQARVVPWWGTGRPAEFSPSGFHPVTGIAYRQEDRRVRLQNRVVSTTARRATRTLSRNEKFEFFWCPSPGGRSVREITSREETERPPENRLGRSNRSREVWQVPGLREFRFAESQQILPLTESLPVTELTGSNLRHARPGAGRALVGNGEIGRTQSQWNQPVTGTAHRQRIGGYDYKTESFHRPRAEQYTHSREMKIFFFSFSLVF